MAVQTKINSLIAWEHWACFTSDTNYSLQKKAETVLRKVSMDSKLTLSALVAFVRGWDRMCENTRHRNAGVADTAVREIVYEFVDRVIQATHSAFGYELVRDIARSKTWKLRKG